MYIKLIIVKAKTLTYTKKPKFHTNSSQYYFFVVVISFFCFDNYFQLQNLVVAKYFLEQKKIGLGDINAKSHSVEHSKA